ncbi:hypothetical protein SDC9_19704 [bioreactor metagenome]|jgi:hypothetical protein|uniref:Uncharacterized protein n=1 Tax=bioreactor metagenome TaxID=1076179 RepID=A0A644U4P3_9ZZZZ
MKKKRLKKLVIKSGENLIDSVLTKDKMNQLIGGESGYCSKPGLACYNFDSGCSNIC